MDFQLGNLAFSLIVGVGGFAATLALLFWFIWKVFLKFKLLEKKKERKVLKSALFLTWSGLVVWGIISTVHSNAPKITLEDYSSQSPSYSEDAKIKDLNPNKMTDEERSKYNQRLFEENQVK